MAMSKNQGDYYYTSDPVEEYINLAKDVNGGQLINQLKDYLSKGAALLELGSGPGSDWELLNNNYQVTGSDNSKQFLQRLRVKYPSEKFLELDAITLATNERFDGIYSNKVLHHLSDEELVDSIKRQHQILNTSGIICHSFWKGEGSEVFKGMYVNYHSGSSLKAAFEKYFDVLILKPYHEFDESDSLLVIAKKKTL